MNPFGNTLLARLAVLVVIHIGGTETSDTHWKTHIGLRDWRSDRVNKSALSQLKPCSLFP